MPLFPLTFFILCLDKKNNEDKEIVSKIKMEKKYILENGKKFFIHPVYKKYAANEEGEIIHVKLGKPRKGIVNQNGYFKFSIYLERNRYKSYLSHRFVFECFYGLIEKNKQINHINFNKKDNRIKNLEVVTASENCRKSAKNRNFGIYRNNPKKVTAINLFTKKETNFNSIYSVSKILDINPCQVTMICSGIYKTATSKINGQKYSFRYLN